jgi:hypothetical protein
MPGDHCSSFCVVLNLARPGPVSRIGLDAHAKSAPKYHVNLGSRRRRERSKLGGVLSSRVRYVQDFESRELLIVVKSTRSL